MAECGVRSKGGVRTYYYQTKDFEDKRKEKVNPKNKGETSDEGERGKKKNPWKRLENQKKKKRKKEEEKPQTSFGTDLPGGR